LKDGDRRTFVESDIIALVAVRDTDKPLDSTARDLVDPQQERLEEMKETHIALPDMDEPLPQDHNH
jgi:hypothetical protein